MSLQQFVATECKEMFSSHTHTHIHTYVHTYINNILQLENVIRAQNRTYKEFTMAQTRMIQIVSDYNSKYKVSIHESILL